MAPAKLRKYAHHLQYLKATTPALAKAIIKSADKGLVNCLCEVGLNVLKGNVPITPQQKRKLSRHKQDLRRIVKRGVGLQSKKRILQKGGFLGALLGPLARIAGGFILPAITSALTK